MQYLSSSTMRRSPVTWPSMRASRRESDALPSFVTVQIYPGGYILTTREEGMEDFRADCRKGTVQPR